MVVSCYNQLDRTLLLLQSTGLIGKLLQSAGLTGKLLQLGGLTGKLLQ